MSIKSADKLSSQRFHQQWTSFGGSNGSETGNVGIGGPLQADIALLTS